MPLTAEQIIYVRRQVGNAPNDATLTSIGERHRNDPDYVVLEVLETRLAEMIRNPASFAVAGEYSQSTGENIRELRKKIERWVAYMLGIGKDPGPAYTGRMRVIHAAPPVKRR